MFHVRKLSNALSNPVVFSSKPTKSSDTTTASNHSSSISPVKSPKSSTKPFHRRARPSIDKSKVSKPFPILAYDEKELFDAMASESIQPRERRIPKVAEKKVKINAPESIPSSSQPKPKVPSTSPSRSWYTPATVDPPVKGTLQRSVSNASPRTTPPKVDVGRASSTKDTRGHVRFQSESLRNGSRHAGRRINKQSITHPDCPWIGSTNAPIMEVSQHRPTRSDTRGSYESDETAVEAGTPVIVIARKEEPVLARSVEDTLRPTIKLVSKPLPDLPIRDSVSSRWSASTGSVYSDGDPFTYDQVLEMFPNPPTDMPNPPCFKAWEGSALTTPPIFMSCSNSSSGSVETITPAITSERHSVKPLSLKAVPEPKVVTVVHQNPRASCSFSRIQDSIAVHRVRACPQVSMKGSVYAPSVRTAGPAPALRRRSSSLSSPNSNPPPGPVVPLEALLFPHLLENPEELKRFAEARQERERSYDLEQQKERELKEFEMEFGFNPWYKGKRLYERDLDSNEFELIKPEKKQRKWL